MKGKKNMGLDGKISADEVYFQKSFFDRFPVVARSPQEAGNGQDAASHAAAIDVEVKNLAAAMQPPSLLWSYLLISPREQGLNIPKMKRG